MKKSLLPLAAALGVLGATGLTFPPVEAQAQSADAGLEALKNQSSAFVEISKRILPAVVSITSSKVITPASGNGGRFFGDELMQRFFEDNDTQEFNQQGSGSGVIVSDEGYILTNNHVIAEADELEVVLYDGRRFQAELVGRDEEADVAVIKIDADDLAIAALGDSDDLEVGEWVLAAGNPFQLSSSITSGIVSAIGRSNIGLAQYENFIQTDAAINPGNSGGALVNLEGEVVGINTAIASRSGGYQGIGFAIPINYASGLMTDLINYGKVTRGYLGVQIGEVDDVMAEYYGLDNANGVLINSVEDDSPAEVAGVKQGDVVVSVNGREVEDMRDLQLRISGFRPGARVDLEVVRDKRKQSLTAELTEKPSLGDTASNLIEDPERKMSERISDIGLEVEDISRRVRDEFELESDVEGAVITNVSALSPAGRANFRAGDIIMKVDDTWVEDVAGLTDAVQSRESGEAVLFLILRQGRELFLALRMPE